MKQPLGRPVLQDVSLPSIHLLTILSLELGPGLPGAILGKGENVGSGSRGCPTGTAGLAGPGISTEESPGDRGGCC